MVSCTTVPVTVPVTPASITLLDGVTISNSNPRIGDSTTLTGTLRNTGGTAGSVTVYINFLGNYVANGVYSVAPNGGTTQVSLSFAVPAAIGGNTVVVGVAYPTCLVIG